MTRSEFIADPPGTIRDLIDFCVDNHLSAADDILPGDELDDRLCEDIREMTRGSYWYNIRDFLNDIPSGCDWYKYEDGEYVDFDDEWETLYDDIIYEMDDEELWDEEDEDDEEEDEDDEDEDDEEDDSFDDSVFSLVSEEPGCENGVFSLDNLIDSSLVSVICAEAEAGDRKRQAELEEWEKARAERKAQEKRAAAEEEERLSREFLELF